MSARLYKMPSRLSAAEEWDRYAALARRLSDDPDAAIDHDFNVELVRAYARWRDAFLASET